MPRTKAALVIAAFAVGLSPSVRPAAGTRFGHPFALAALRPESTAPIQTQAPAARALEPKDRFVGAIRAFLEATAGSYGDEQEQAGAALGAMTQALTSWDQALLLREAPSFQASSADQHWRLGLAFLDRRRIADALKEFDLADALQPQRPEIQTLRGFAYDLMGRAVEATAAFAKAAALNPADPTTSYRLAQHLTSLGRRDQSIIAWQQFRESQLENLVHTAGMSAAQSPFIRIDLIRQAANVAPIFPQARYDNGFSALVQGHYDDVVLRLREAVRSDPLIRADVTSGPASEGSAALRQGRLAQALRLLKAAAQSSPELSETHRVLGMAYWADDQYDAAIEQFTLAVRLRSDDERARVALGRTMVAAGKLSAAEEVFKDAIHAIPESGQAHYDLGRLYEFLQQWSQAAEMFQAAADRNPVVGLDYLLQTIVHMYLSLPDFDKAVQAATKRVEINPNNAEAHRALGDLLLRQGQNDEALTELLAALLINPRDADAFSGMAQVYLRTARFAEAEEAARRALDLDPMQKAARYALAIALTRIGRAEEGATELERFQQLQAETEVRERRELEVKMLQQEVSTSLAREDYDAAIAALRRAIPYDPGSASSYLNLGVVLKKSGRLREAIESLDKALELKAGPDAYRLLADTYDALGQPDEGRRYRAMYDQAKAERLRTTGWMR
jgi:tetratricopeptide (TPR) repeat protein